MTNCQHRFDFYSPICRAFKCHCGAFVDIKAYEAYGREDALAALSRAVDKRFEVAAEVARKLSKIARLAREQGDVISPSQMEMLADELMHEGPQ